MPSAGDIIRASDLFVPRVKVYSTANQSIANTTVTVISGYTADYDNDDMYAAGSPTLITFNSAGVYIVCYGIRYASNATGYRGALLRLNDVSDIGNVYNQAANGITTNLSGSVMHEFDVGDFLTLAARQNSGGSLNALGGEDEYTFIQATRIAITD